MFDLTRDYIRTHVADSPVIYQRGVHIYRNGSYVCADADPENGFFSYDVDGNYGDYTATIHLGEEAVEFSCDCPYPGDGCKHAVAVLLDVYDRIQRWRPSPKVSKEEVSEDDPFLTPQEIREQALEDRRKRSLHEEFTVTLGEMYKGEHLLETPRGRQYQVTLHDPGRGAGHCSCPDYLTNRLGTCKHIIHLCRLLRNKDNFEKRLGQERFPFADIYWDSVHDLPRLFCERPAIELEDLQDVFSQYFAADGLFARADLSELLPLLSRVDGNKRVRVQEPVIKRLDDFLVERQMEKMRRAGFPPLPPVRTTLYPYQEEGVRYALYKKAALIGDEMGLGKTLQAIVIGLLKKQVFGFEKILIVTAASLKEQWKREIERFTEERAVVVAGNPSQREALYSDRESLFKITNYEAVLRDTTILSRFKPDLVILDEAQRIKNFTTKTADAVKSLHRTHCLVLTGTPLENKLEDVYSIVQFLDPHMLAPLWRFAGDHFLLSRHRKGKILGYRNLESLQEKLKTIVIRRKKEQVLSDLPDQVVNSYFVELTDKQLKIHNSYLQLLLPLLDKKYLTPMDVRRIQELLLKMRLVCDSTYLIDRKTNISPKLKELEGILDELVVQNGRKTVIFSEWTTMNFLIAKHLSEVGIPFVELSGKIPVHKRQALIDEFTCNPRCKVFLSTDAGGTGLNLQAADCVVNFELPWNPARMNQRIGRVHRIGQKSRCVNIVNLISRNSIEEKILAGLQLKKDLFDGVFEEGGPDMVEFSHERRMELLNRLREMMGEEPLATAPETRPAEEIPEDTPHYLNPKVLAEQEPAVDYEAEESALESAPVAEPEPMDGEGAGGSGGGALERQPPEKVEEVLNSGMRFLTGLLEMATGRKVESTDADERMIRIDRNTGEVTMKFRLPTF